MKTSMSTGTLESDSAHMLGEFEPRSAARATGRALVTRRGCTVDNDDDNAMCIAVTRPSRDSRPNLGRELETTAKARAGRTRLFLLWCPRNRVPCGDSNNTAQLSAGACFCCRCRCWPVGNSPKIYRGDDDGGGGGSHVIGSSILRGP
jgi:hypothetical protein